MCVSSTSLPLSSLHLRRRAQVHDRQPGEPRPGLPGHRLQGADGGLRCVPRLAAPCSHRLADSLDVRSQATACRSRACTRSTLAATSSSSRWRGACTSLAVFFSNPWGTMLTLMSLRRYGTDCYIHLSRLSQSSEPLQVRRFSPPSPRTSRPAVADPPSLARSNLDRTSPSPFALSLTSCHVPSPFL